MARKNVRSIIDENIDNIAKWTADGLSLKQISDKLGVCERTLYRWQNKSLELGQTIKKGRNEAVETLENSMFKAACGYERVVKKYAKVKRILYDEMTGKRSSEYEEMVEYEETVYYPPDTTSAIFLLKNWGGYMNEPRAMEIRKKELALAEKKAEATAW